MPYNQFNWNTGQWEYVDGGAPVPIAPSGWAAAGIPGVPTGATAGGGYAFGGGGGGGGGITPEHREGLRSAGYSDWNNPALTEADFARISAGARAGGGGGGAPAAAGGMGDWQQIFGAYAEAQKRDYELRVAQMEFEKLKWLSQMGANPQDWVKYFQARHRLQYPTAAPTGARPADIAAARGQLETAGYAQPTMTDLEATQQYARTVGAGQMTPLAERLRMAYTPPETEWPEDIRRLGGLWGLPEAEITQQQWGSLGPAMQQMIAGGVEAMGTPATEWLAQRQRTSPLMAAVRGLYRY